METAAPGRVGRRRAATRAAFADPPPYAVKRLGLIVNPLAGIGGRVGLKGSDGDETVRRAFELGAVCLSPRRSTEALEPLAALAGDLELFTYPGLMGEDEAQAAGLRPVVVGTIDPAHTSAADTYRAAAEMAARGVDLLLFAGGDGTARDISDAVGGAVPALGIPTGCKIHSGVFAANPRAAGELARLFLEGAVTRTSELEVMDIDEDAFRHDELRARLYGYLRVPHEPRFTQGAKAGARGLTDEAAAASIAERVVEDMRPGRLYVIGSGTTPRAVMERLGLPNTLLGIDVVRNGRLIAADATEKDLLTLLEQVRSAGHSVGAGARERGLDTVETSSRHTAETPARETGGPHAVGSTGAEIVVTPVGGQGFIFGRGNQQLSPEVIRRVGADRVLVIATPAKLLTLPFHRLRVDTTDPAVDALLRGYRRVVTGYRETAVVEVV